MKKALISPLEQIFDFEGTEIGARVCQVEDQIFEVAEPMFWTDCDDQVVADRWYFDTLSTQIKEVPPTPVMPIED